MVIYYGFLSLATLFLRLRDLFNDIGRAIFKVWLLGDNLAPWMFLTSSKFYSLYAQYVLVAQDWLSFYNQLQQAIKPSAITATILRYADDLISLVLYFDQWAEDWLRRNWYDLYSFARNPANYLINLLLRSTGFDLSFIYNPRAAIESIVFNSLGNIRTFLSNPAEFIVRSLLSYFPQLTQILQDPDGWLLSRLSRLAPALSDFIQDPDAFIFEAFRRQAERRLSALSDLVVTIGTKILEAIW